MMNNSIKHSVEIHDDNSHHDTLVIRKYTKYLFSLVGFAIGSVISILFVVFEDNKIDLDIYSFYSDFYHLAIPLLFWLTGTLIGYLHGKREDRKRIEHHEISLSQKNLSLIFDHLPVLISYMDSDLRYRFVNKTHEDWLGLSMEDIYGKSIKELVSEKAYKKIEFNIKKAAEGEIINFESVREINGTDRFLNSTIIPYKDENQKTKGYFSIVSDISELKIREHKIKEQNAELAELNATKDKFFSIIAHDLKNPFSSLLGFSEILFKEYDDFEEFTRRKFIKAIYESSENTYKLLENLLAWSRSQSGRIEFNPSVVNIKTLVNENLILVNQLAVEKNIRLKSGIHEDLFVSTDKDLVNTVIRNLLTNALKFTPPKGEVIVSGSVVSDESQSEWIEVSVRDTGVGISSDNMEKLFKIDRQYSTKGTKGESGTGLGLLLCKEFIEKCNGKIGVESQVEKGSIFKFLIPRE